MAKKIENDTVVSDGGGTPVVGAPEATSKMPAWAYVAIGVVGLVAAIAGVWLLNK